jgi:B9 domain-containing protein 1
MEAIARARLNSTKDVQDDGPRNILVNINGAVESGVFRGHRSLAVTYDFSYGPDWRIQEGPMLATNDSQYAANENERSGLGGSSIVWNFPISSTFSTTNPFGWPRLVLTCVDKQLVVRGYGAVLVPTCAGKYTRYVHMFSPRASSPLQDFLGWLLNAPAEFRDTKFPARNGDREVTRVQSAGVIKVTFNVTTKHMKHFGYTEGKTLSTSN